MSDYLTDVIGKVKEREIRQRELNRLEEERRNNRNLRRKQQEERMAAGYGAQSSNPSNANFTNSVDVNSNTINLNNGVNSNFQSNTNQSISSRTHSVSNSSELLVNQPQNLKMLNNSELDALIRRVPNYPKEGINFFDITTLIKDKMGFKSVIQKFADRYKNKKIDYIVGAESRGFIFGCALAYELGVGFIPARKKGKLPSLSVRAEYDLEYGSDAIEIHKDAINQGDNILIIDDLLATGGTINAISSLVKHLGGNIVELAFVLDLKNLHGTIDYPYYSILSYEVDE